MTGDVGFNTDAEEIFGSLDTKLLLATVLLVLILLGAIYRSPLIALMPLVVVGFAYGVAQGLIYFYAKSGATVSSNSTSILVVLMFGVGTDYCLLLVSRYREELRRFEDKHDAMAHALCALGPGDPGQRPDGRALDAGAARWPRTASIQSLGPVAAIGVACVAASPASRCCRRCSRSVAGGRSGRARSVVACDPEHAVAERAGIWRRIGDRVLAAARAWRSTGTVLLFAVGALGLLAYKEDYSTTTFFKKQTESVDGFKVLERAFPAGALSPTTVLVEREDGPVRPADVAARAPARRDAAGRGAVTPPPGRSRDGRIVRFDVDLQGGPVPRRARSTSIPKLRDRARRGSAPGVQRARGRRNRDPVRLRPGVAPRPEADRADRAASLIARDPRHPAAGDRRAAGADRVGGRLVLRHLRPLDPVLPLRGRRRGRRQRRCRCSRSSSWSRSASTTRSS